MEVGNELLGAYLIKALNNAKEHDLCKWKVTPTEVATDEEAPGLIVDYMIDHTKELKKRLIERKKEK